MPVKQTVRQLCGHSFPRLHHCQQVFLNFPSDTGTPREEGACGKKLKEQQQLTVIMSISAVLIKLEQKKGQMLYSFPVFSPAHFLSKQQAA